VIVPGRFFDGQTAVPHAVSVQLQNGDLVIRGAEIAPDIVWPAGTVRRSDGDIAGRAMGLRRKGEPARLVLQDAALFAALREAGAAIDAPVTWSSRRWAALAAGIVVSVVVAAVMVDQIPGLLVPLVPQRVERAWSGQIEGVFRASANVCEGQEGGAALRRLFDRLGTAAGLPSPPDFEVLDTNMVNAFTLPGGRILVLRGLIDNAQDPDELAGVLAHELGHVKHRDPTREMLRRMALSMIARSMGWGGNVASTMAALSYGRRAEAAADASAVETLHKAGLRADGLGRFFAMLLKRTGEPGVPAFLSDHPSTTDRAARLKQPAIGQSALTPEEWASVRKMCGP
jgi:predicted Zn-dependent protease